MSRIKQAMRRFRQTGFTQHRNKVASTENTTLSQTRRSKRSLHNTPLTSSSAKSPTLRHGAKEQNGRSTRLSMKKIRRGSKDSETTTVCHDLDPERESWAILPSDVIFQIGDRLTLKEALSVRLVNKHWSIAGRSFITSLRLSTEKEFNFPLQLSASLQLFSDDTFLHLRELEISSSFQEGYEALSHLTKLTSLNVSGCLADTHQFAGLKALKNLCSLSLRWTKLKDEGMHYLLDLTKLSILYLDCCNITESSIPLLAGLTNLSTLSLRGLPTFSDECLKPLGMLNKMVCLDLSGMFLSDIALSPILNLTQLTDLNLSMNDITSQALEKISVLWRLRKLSLSRTKVGNEGLVYITFLERLEVLDLSGSMIDDRGLHHLAHLRFLSYLDLSDNFMLCQNKLEHLMPLAGLKFLRRMNLQRTLANGIGVEMFSNAVKPRKISIDYSENGYIAAHALW